MDLGVFEVLFIGKVRKWSMRWKVNFIIMVIGLFYIFYFD